MRAHPLYAEIAGLLGAVKNCEQAGNQEWLERHKDALEQIERNLLPRGSGVDCGTKIDEASTPNKIILTLSFHHLNEHGSYDRWTEHTCIITPDLQFAISIDITGPDRNGILDYLHDLYRHTLMRRVERVGECYQLAE
jgi:hypothetical protein